MTQSEGIRMRGTTILAVAKDDMIVVVGDGQVTLGDTVMKGNAKKVRRLYQGKVVVGFAGSTADAFTLFERFEAKLKAYGGNLRRSAVELARDAHCAALAVWLDATDAWCSPLHHVSLLSAARELSLLAVASLRRVSPPHTPSSHMLVISMRARAQKESRSARPCLSGTAWPACFGSRHFPIR